LLSDTPLDKAVLFYLGLLLLRFVLDGFGLTGAWGLYVSVMYLPLFWLIPAVLKDKPAWFNTLLALLVGVGAVVALGGLIEFLLDVTLWPSDETVQRLGFPDVYIYGTHVRRVYFTLDSPTALANMLALLLPVSLAIFLRDERKWVRIGTGLATLLMAVCIVVTFSRGIWVAAVLSLLVMGLLSRVLQRNKRILMAAAGVLLLVGLAWGLVTVLRSGQDATSDQTVIEFSSAAFDEAPVSGVEQELLEIEPAAGESELQSWTLFDPIAGRDDQRQVLYMHPPSSGKKELVYQVSVPTAGALRFGIALSPEVWTPEQGDGVSFQLYVADPDRPQDGQFVLVRYINPKHNPSDRRWRNFLVDLSDWAGRKVNLSFIVESGPNNDWAFDWGGWAEPQLVRVEPDAFSSAEAENAVLRHTGSILDWVKDETNRDRLAAWSQAFRVWREAPLWGSGLGSTGVAALRTDPENAFVTESQVLKALVELGLPGILVLGYLWYQIGQVAYSAFRGAADPGRRLLLLGILVSLLMVFIEGWVYQNLEVKQVNAYFWTLVGFLAFLTHQQDE